MRILLYADLDLRLTDGSSTWLASVSEVLARLGHDVHVLSKVYFTESTVLVRTMKRHGNVQVHLPQRAASERTPWQAVQDAVRLHQQLRFDVVIVRGFAACFEFATESTLAPLLWSYVTDLPFPLDALTPTQTQRLTSVAKASRRMLAQTEAARSYLESVAPAAAGKTVLMPPMVPDEAFAAETVKDPDVLQLVYAGKLAKDWRIREMLALPEILATRGVRAHLTVIGDKFQYDPASPAWADDLRTKLEAASADPSVAVTWRGGLSRDAVLAQIAAAHIGLGWRTAALDSSLEISTKALEYSACGTAPLINRSSDHELIWGSEYPLFVRSDDDAKAVADRIIAMRPALPETAVRARDAVVGYSMSEAEQRLARQLQRGATAQHSSDAPTVLTIASHDFKFLGELVDSLRQDQAVDLRIDGWTSLHTHDEATSRTAADGAGVIFCEWAGPALVWHANNKSARTRLVTRLHGFELRGPWLATLDVDAVDHWIFVSEHYRAVAIEQLGLKADATSVIPNMVDVDDLRRPKVAGHGFQLGLAGIVGFGKRPDRALDLLTRLLEHDDRYTLRIKGRAPWEYPHEWRDALQRQLYLDFYSRIGADQSLRDHVIFEPFSPDMGSWFRQVGIVLSPSHAESFHLAPAEGMASGAVPVIWQRPGAATVFGREWIIDDTAEAAERILGLRDRESMHSAQQRAVEQANQWDRDFVMPLWRDALGHL